MNARRGIARMTARLLALVLLCQAGLVHAGLQSMHHVVDAATAATAADSVHHAGHHDDSAAHCAETTALPACDDHSGHACPLCAGACGSALPAQSQAIAPDSAVTPSIAVATIHLSAPTDSPYRPPTFG